jgi:hypothetical protein
MGGGTVYAAIVGDWWIAAVLVVFSSFAGFQAIRSGRRSDW